MSEALKRYQHLNREWRHVTHGYRHVDNWRELADIIEKDLEHVWMLLDQAERDKIDEEYENGRRYNTAYGDRSVILTHCRFCS
jgi:hypothetical protein